MKSLVLILFFGTVELFPQEIPSLLSLCVSYVNKNIDLFDKNNFKKLPIETVEYITKRLNQIVLEIEKDVILSNNPPISVEQSSFSYLLEKDNKIIWPNVLFPYYETYNNILFITDTKTFNENASDTRKISFEHKTSLGININTPITCFASHSEVPNHFALGRDSGHITAFIINSQEKNKIVEEYTHCFENSPVMQVSYDQTGNYLICYYQSKKIYICYYKHKKAVVKIDNIPLTFFNEEFFDPHFSAHLNFSNTAQELPKAIPIQFLADNLDYDQRLLLLEAIQVSKKLSKKKVKESDIQELLNKIINSNFEESVKKYLYGIVQEAPVENTLYNRYQLLVQLKEKFSEIKDLVINHLWNFNNFFQ